LLALLSAVIMLVALASPAVAGGNTQVKPHHNDVQDSFNTDNSQDHSQDNDTAITTDDDVTTDVTTVVCSTGAVIGTLDCHGSS
jgi:hypothetical protein